MPRSLAKRRKISKPKRRSTRLTKKSPRNISSKRSGRIPRCQNATDADVLVTINSMRWDIQHYPEDAMLNNMSLRENSALGDLEWCGGDLKLLLPIVTVYDDTSMIVYYQQRLRKARITIRDILNLIYKFYNDTKVIPGDLTYISVTETMRHFAETSLNNYYKDPGSIDSLRFVHFMGGQTKFGGLKHQREDLYTLRLI